MGPSRSFSSQSKLASFGVVEEAGVLTLPTSPASAGVLARLGGPSAFQGSGSAPPGDARDSSRRIARACRLSSALRNVDENLTKFVHRPGEGRRFRILGRFGPGRSGLIGQAA
jgi:hypothetical protein